MSEYQYFEWLAIDRPLNDKQLAEVSRLSSHMDVVTPTQAVVTYSWGDFKHDPIKVLAEYFDGFLYVSNWGTTQLAFRFPAGAVDPRSIQPYLSGDDITFSRKGAYAILEIRIDDENGGGDDWMEEERLLGRIAPARQQIIDGDYRALYLGWLARVSLFRNAGDNFSNELEEMIEPPAPANLNNLNGALAALRELFNIDKHLVEAAAMRSPKASEPSPADLRAAIKALPRERADDYLLRLLNDEPQLGSALRKEIMPPRVASASDEEPRTAAELLAEAARLKSGAQKHQAEAARHARIAELEKLALREESAWGAVDKLLQQGKTTLYGSAVQQLVDLRDLAQHRGTLPAFQARLGEIVTRYGSRRALMNRLKSARLIQ
jgi:hypothetical protein